jgi:hypothetical protein
VDKLNISGLRNAVVSSDNTHSSEDPIKYFYRKNALANVPAIALEQGGA